MTNSSRFAFYDFDGTLVSSNIVSQYAWNVCHLPSRSDALGRYLRLLVSVPIAIGLELNSRRRFTTYMYRKYRGMNQVWLEEKADALFEDVFRPKLFPGAKALVDADKAAGFQTVLVTGNLDFALGAVVRFFGFDHLIANSLVFRQGVATGEMAAPNISEADKVAAMQALSREYNVDTALSKAYSDSMSDLPMLEAVGFPSVVHPGRRLRRIAVQRGWPILDLKER